MFFDIIENNIILRVRISPNSSCCLMKGIFVSVEGQQFLKVNVISVPEKGKANRELIEFLAKKLKIAKSKMEIISGDTDKYKKILIKYDIEQIKDNLEELGKEE